jgi:sulfite reductase (NADPH) flavoprotein alpha-component
MTVTRTACSYCGVGCGIEVTTTIEAGVPVIAKVAGDKSHPANFGRSCTKGATHAEMMAADGDRLKSALLRPSRDEEPVPTPVDDAVAEAGRRLRAIVDADGPDSVALYVSGQMSIEAQYLANKLAKGFVRTVAHRVEFTALHGKCGHRVQAVAGSRRPAWVLHRLRLHRTVFRHRLEYGRLSSDPFPADGRAHEGRPKSIVVDPRRTATAERADLYLQIKPGTDLALLNWLLHLLVESGDIDTDFIAEHTEGWAEMPEFLADYPPHRVSEITGIPEADIRTAARMIADAGEWMSCWTMGLN